MKINEKNKLKYILCGISLLVAMLIMFSLANALPVLGVPVNAVNDNGCDCDYDCDEDDCDCDDDCGDDGCSCDNGCCDNGCDCGNDCDCDDEPPPPPPPPPPPGQSAISFRIGDAAVVQLNQQQRTQARSAAGFTVTVPCADLFNAATRAFTSRNILVSLTQERGGTATPHTNTATQSFNGDRDLRLTVTDVNGAGYTVVFIMTHGNLAWTHTNDNVCCNSCVVCGTAVSSMPHNWVEGTVVQEGSCTHGRIFHEDCTRCNTRRLRTIPAGNHVEEREVIQQATCTLPEIVRYTCTVEGCGHYRIVENAPLGHDFAEHESDVAPTCTEPGSRSRDCRRCGYSQNQVAVPPLGHNFEVVLEATCTVPGMRRCQACYIEEEIEPTGEHEWDEGVVEREPAPGQPGQLMKTCLVCNTIHREAIPYQATTEPGGTSAWTVFMWIFVFVILLGSAGVAVYFYMVKDGQLPFFNKNKVKENKNTKDSIYRANNTNVRLEKNRAEPKDPWED
ncbi:MAG: hypothetical protein FWB93_03120 [Oscillospiraceae bacterium]|nr:hypothetical protein [Oscillospiraceae bacterium]